MYDDDVCILPFEDCGKVRVLVDYILQALWWLKSPMRDAHDLLHFGQMNASVGGTCAVARSF
jgi:hypothetical protein